MRLVIANQATASKRRVYFHLVQTDGITPATGEAGGQPQISTDGVSWTNTGIGTLTAIGNGRYYADLDQATVATAGEIVETRYKSAGTAECPGDSVQVVGFDIDIAKVTLADGVAHGGSTATLELGANSSTVAALQITQANGDNFAVKIDNTSLTGTAGAMSIFATSSSGVGLFVGGNSIGISVAGRAEFDGISSFNGFTGDLHGSVDTVGLINTGGIDAGSFSPDAITANALATDATLEIADALLARNIKGGSSTGRLVSEALAASRNKVLFDTPALNQFTVFDVDDITPLWVGTYSRGANTLGPLVGVDPN